MRIEARMMMAMTERLPLHSRESHLTCKSIDSKKRLALFVRGRTRAAQGRWSSGQRKALVNKLQTCLSRMEAPLAVALIAHFRGKVWGEVIHRQALRSLATRQATQIPLMQASSCELHSALDCDLLSLLRVHFTYGAVSSLGGWWWS
eukprot:2610735-Amphidinium_carterae.1